MKNNKLTIKWNVYSVLMYSLFWIYSSIVILALALVSPMYIIVGVCLYGFSFNGKNILTKHLNKMQEYHEMLEAELTPKSSKGCCPFYKQGLCTAYEEYYESVGYRDEKEFNTIKNMKCLSPVNRFRCERVHDRKRMIDKINKDK